MTTIICARNAASTIGRAVRSALQQNGPVIVVDDWSSDGTADIARRMGGNDIMVVRPPSHRTLGFARQTGVQAVGTKWLMWLDADDELLPGRANHLCRVGENNNLDAVWDAAILFDGERGGLVGELPMPSFLLKKNAAVRLFERNYTPGLAWPIVRTSFAAKIGYDAILPTADDLDFFLRGLCANGKFGFLTDFGYRQYSYSGSLSRDLKHQRRWVSFVLKRFDYQNVARLYLKAGYSAQVTAWGLVSMSLFRSEPEAALHFLKKLRHYHLDADEILEPSGPLPVADGWRYAFFRGTALLLLEERDKDAVQELTKAELILRTAEGSNNLGVALSRLGNTKEAFACFSMASSMFEGYHDALLNLQSDRPSAITTHPLRMQPSRKNYQV